MRLAVGLRQQPRGEPPRFVGLAGERRIGDAAFEKGRPEAPARLALRQHPLGGAAERIAEAGERAELRRQHRLDAGAELLREHRPAPVEVIAIATGARFTIAGV